MTEWETRGEIEPDVMLNNQGEKRIMEIDCLILSSLLLFPCIDTQSISSEGREGKQHVDNAVEKAIHQCCRRAV